MPVATRHVSNQCPRVLPVSQLLSMGQLSSACIAALVQGQWQVCAMWGGRLRRTTVAPQVSSCCDRQGLISILQDFILCNHRITALHWVWLSEHHINAATHTCKSSA